MSLHAAAQHLSSQGRGPDNTLVHMSKGELKSLNDLAMAHGGQLTINPQTGLPEAGFLSSILPVVAGAALNAFVPGLGAMGSALLTGAVSGIASGSLSKGLMAGMGAYGGAGLMGGLMGAGTNAMTTAGLGDYAGTLAGQGLQAGTPEYGAAASKLALEAQNQAMAAPFMDKAKAGFSQIGEAPGQFFKDNWKYAAAAAPSVIEAVSGSGGKPPATTSDKDMGQGYVYEPNKLQGPYTASPTGVEQQYFNPNFRKVSGAEAKSVFGYASGGAVDEPVKYDYDPLTQIFKKIESMPSDNQKVNEPSPIGRGSKADSNQARINSYFDGMTPAQLSQHQANQANVINALMPGSAVVAGLKALTGGESSNPISPLAVPSLAMSKLGDAAQTGLGLVLNKFAKPNPNPDAVQVVDMSTLSPAAEGEQAQQQAQQAQQAQAIATALAGLQGTGGDGGMSAGFGAPGATSGNAGAMGFGPSGMAGGYGGGSTGATSGSTGGGGAPGAPGLGVSSGGGYGISASMGGTAGVGGTAGAAAGAARGGLMAAYSNGGSHLGDYSDGGRLLRGPGDGVSDSIPAMIGKKQPARLADGEFVVPARIVSELGNGSTEAGARKLYAMLDRVQASRKRTVGKGKVAKNNRADKYLPA
jgi:hypothetical protein